MASRKRSWSIRLARGAKTWSVRVWLPTEGRTVELSTGERDPERAEARGAQIATELLAGKRAAPDPRRSACDQLSIADVGLKWLQAIRGRLAGRTIGAYAEVVDTHLSAAFGNLLDVSWESARAYIDKRLKVVQPQTIRHELSVLRMMVEWAAEQRLISNPPRIPSIPKRAAGTPFAKRRRVKADEYSPEEVRAFVDGLPDRSPRGFWVRPRYELQYETGVRSGTLDKLSVPEHWRPGERVLRLEKRVLKSRKPYVLPISDRAFQILTRVAPKTGLVFGKHDLRDYVSEAAEKAMPVGKADLFAPTHLRSAFGSHLIEDGASLDEAQYMLGHSRPSTTDRYIRARQHKAESALRRLGRRA